MQEKIIFAPGAKGTELLRSLANHGKGQTGTRVMGAIELARFSNMRCGITPSTHLLSFQEQAGVIYSLLSEPGLEYFGNYSYADAENITRALNVLRSLITGDEPEQVAETLNCGDFKEKNKALLTIYNAYMNRCVEQGLSDTVAYIREAAENAAPMEAEFIVLKEFPLDPLQRKLLNAVSGGSYAETGLPELFGVKDAPIRVEEYTSAYGISNEVEDIIGKIYKNGYPLDQCTVAAADPLNYSQLFYDFSQSSGIPMTFGCGIPILNTHPARLLKLLAAWNGKGLNGEDALNDVIFSPSFDRSALMDKLEGFDNPLIALRAAVKTAGQLRLGMDAEANKERLDARESVETEEEELRLLPIIRELFHDFEKGYGHIIRKYSVIRPQPDGQLDSAAEKLICDSLYAMRTYTDAEDLGEENIIEGILSKTVRSQSSEAGCLHVCTINDALSTMRRHLFIAGISADVFPGSPTENYLLLDSDFGAYADAAPTSEKQILIKRSQYDDLLRFASAMGTDIRISYPAFSHSDLKEINASYDLLRSFREEHGRDMQPEDEESAGFFKHIFNPSSSVGREYMNGGSAEGAETPPIASEVAYDIFKSYSPTAIETWLSCPRCFYLMYVLHIKQPEDNDPYRVIDPRDEGHLAHDLLESLQPDTSLEDFLERSAKAFDDYLKKVPPIVPDMAEKVRSDFTEMMRNGWEDDPRNTPVLSEEDLSAAHPSGVNVHGYPDRVEVTADGRYIIADYKTGRHIGHVENDPETCFQALLYAWLLEETKGIRIDHVEFRYPRIRETISCDYNKNTKTALSGMLETFRNGLVSGIYRPCDECDKYCRFAEICKKARKEAMTDEG